MTDCAFSNCKYSAFFSYATYDEDEWNSFVASFATEMNRSLPSLIRKPGLNVPGVYLSGQTPLVQGSLSDQLREKIASSFSMFIFVHDNYVHSDYCLQELLYFKQLWGDKGFRERLYIVAMSRSAIQHLMNHSLWKQLCPNPDQIWLDFFQAESPDIPLDIYVSQTVMARLIVASPFWKRFCAVRENLAKKIRSAIDNERRPVTYPCIVPSTAAPREDENLVRVYIEGNKDQEKYWESLGVQIETSWEYVIETLRIEPHLYLRPTGLPMSEIDQRPFLDDADGVVLLWGQKTPDSLVAQIKKVEPKLSGPNFAPGLIVYLKEGDRDIPQSLTVGNWNVVRFQVTSAGAAHVLPADVPLLARFLNSVLERKRRRLAPTPSEVT